MHIRLICLGLVLLFATRGLPADKPTDSLLDRLDQFVIAQEFDSTQLAFLCEECIQAPNPAFYSALKKLLDRTIKVAEKDNSDYQAQTAVSKLIHALCALDGQKGYDTVVQRYAELPANSNLQSDYLQALLPYACKRQIEDLLAKRNKIQVDFPVVSQKLPEELSDMPRDLQSAWQYYKNVMAPYERYQKQRDDKEFINIQQNWPQFYKIVQNTLIRPKVDTLTCLIPFEWGLSCGTGSERLYGLKSRTVFLAMVKNGRYAESIGASLQIQSSMFGTQFGDPMIYDFRWQKQLYEFVGLDWEKLYLGAWLDEMGFGRDHLAVLASYGSEKTALRIAQIAPLAHEHAFWISNYIDSLSTMIQRKDKISGENQQKLLKVLHKFAHADANPNDLESAVTALSKLKRPESIPVLKRAARLPHYSIAVTAATALREMGITVPIPTPPKPVTFLFSYKGKPLKRKKVTYELIENDLWFSLGSATTDKQGRLNLDGEYFVDPRYLVNHILFSSDTMRGLDDMMFVTTVPPLFNIPTNPPFDLKNETAIHIQTHELKVIFNNMPEPKALNGQSITLHLDYLKPLQSPECMIYSQAGHFTLNPTDSCIFPRLGNGRYRISVQVPGRAHWKSGVIVMNQDREQVINLKPGADMRFKLIAPGGELADNEIKYELYGPDEISKSKYLDFQTNTYKGLPQGKYKLKIWSSEEKRNQALMWGRFNIVPVNCSSPFEYSGQEIPFTISGEKPLVDLGTIRLSPVKAK